MEIPTIQGEMGERFPGSLLNLIKNQLFTYIDPSRVCAPSQICRILIEIHEVVFNINFCLSYPPPLSYTSLVSLPKFWAWIFSWALLFLPHWYIHNILNDLDKISRNDFGSIPHSLPWLGGHAKWYTYLDLIWWLLFCCCCVVPILYVFGLWVSLFHD